MPRPNIVLTFADDQRHSLLGCWDGPTADAVNTPHLDALASRGLRWTHVYHAGSPVGAVCVPSRAMLHSGRGPFDLPADMIVVGGNETDSFCGLSKAPTLGQRLRDAGYVTHAVGKWHNDEASLKRSFHTAGMIFLNGMADHFNMKVVNWDSQDFHDSYQAGCHSTDIFSEEARCWLEQYVESDDDRPFFLFVAFTAPHDPRRTHQQWHDHYPHDQIHLPHNFRGEHPFNNGELRVRDEKLTPQPRDDDQTRREIADYYAMTEHMDHGIGRIHQRLTELGLIENTLVIHSGDHGLAVGQHGLFGKQNLYDHSVRVPLVMAGPNIPVGQVRSNLCYQHDLHPTLLEAADAMPTDSAPHRPLFRSLWPAIKSAHVPVHEYIGSYYKNQQRMVTDGKRKQIRFRLGNKEWMQNFDLEADPWETLDDDGQPMASCDATACNEYFENWLTTTSDPWT